MKETCFFLQRPSTCKTSLSNTGTEETHRYSQPLFHHSLYLLLTAFFFYLIFFMLQALMTGVNTGATFNNAAELRKILLTIFTDIYR